MLKIWIYPLGRESTFSGLFGNWKKVKVLVTQSCPTLSDPMDCSPPGPSVHSGSDGEELACNAGDPGSIPGLRRFPGEMNGYTLEYSCLENSRDRRAWFMGSQRVRHNWATNLVVKSLSTVLFLWKHTNFNYNSIPLFLIGVSLSQSLPVGFKNTASWDQYSGQSVRLFHIASNQPVMIGKVISF